MTFTVSILIFGQKLLVSSPRDDVRFLDEKLAATSWTHCRLGPDSGTATPQKSIPLQKNQDDSPFGHLNSTVSTSGCVAKGLVCVSKTDCQEEAKMESRQKSFGRLSPQNVRQRSLDASDYTAEQLH